MGRAKINDGVSATSAYSKVFDTLLDEILNFRLKPFALISEKAVSDSLQVSRSPVREALAKLASIGMVDIYAQRGSVVSPLRVRDLENSQFLRECVEVGLLSRACMLPNRKQLVQRLYDEIAIQETLASISDHNRFNNSDELFHQYIAASAGFPGIWSDISTAKLHMNRFKKLTYPNMDSLATIINQHKLLADAIKDGNILAATAAMQAHLRKIFPLIPNLIEKFPQYFETTNISSAPRIFKQDLRFLSDNSNDIS